MPVILGWEQEDQGSKSVQANCSQDPISKITREGVVEWLKWQSACLESRGSESKAQYAKKKKKKKYSSK
jgi:hypothetical protein